MESKLGWKCGLDGDGPNRKKTHKAIHQLVNIGAGGIWKHINPVVDLPPGLGGSSPPYRGCAYGAPLSPPRIFEQWTGNGGRKGRAGDLKHLRGRWRLKTTHRLFLHLFVSPHPNRPSKAVTSIGQVGRGPFSFPRLPFSIVFFLLLMKYDALSIVYQSYNVIKCLKLLYVSYVWDIIEL